MAPRHRPNQNGNTNTSSLEEINKLFKISEKIILDTSPGTDIIVTISQVPKDIFLNGIPRANRTITPLNATRDEVAEMVTTAINGMLVAAPSIGPGSVVKPIKCFELFNNLPAEIRAQIWSLNLPGPCIVEVKLRPGKKVLLGNLSFFQCTKNPQIANLAVCQESRYEALKVFSLAFQDRMSPSRLIVNFSTDTVFFNCVRLVPRSSSSTLYSTLCQITRLALKNDTAKNIMKGFFACFPCLQEIILLVDGRNTLSKLGMTKLFLHGIPAVHVTPTMGQTKRIIEAAYAAYHENNTGVRPLQVLFQCLHAVQ